MTIGVLGIGKMGFPIACNLSADGNHVVVYDVFEPAREKLTGTDLEWCATPREVISKAELTFFVGLQCNQLKAMLDGENGVLAGLQGAQKTIVDLSTSDPSDSAALGAYLKTQGVDYVDCGMTGGVVGARERKLVFMAGGDRAVYDKYAPVMEKLSKSLTFIGPQGCGHRMKLLHNAVSNSVFTVTIEACALGKLYDMDLQAMIDVMNVGNARSYATEVRFPKYILSDTYDMGYLFSTGRKDFEMIKKLADDMNYKMPMAETTLDYWVWNCDNGRADEDVTVLYKTIAEKNTKE